MSHIAIIRVRGTTGVRKQVEDTLNMLNLKSKNACVIVPKTPGYMGMIKLAKDYITWGEISAETAKKMQETRTETKIIKGKKVASKTYRLSPPRGGFGRKGIKKDFTVGGGLGYRGEKINALIEKMI